jgi:hypothetical protein
MRPLNAGLAFLGVMVCCNTQAQACGPFLGLAAKPTLREEVASARVVLYGTLANPRRTAVPGEGVTDLHVHSVLKGGPDLKGPRVVELPRLFPVPDPRNPPAFLVFFDLEKGKLSPYRDMPIKSAAILDYLKGAVALDRKKSSEFLSYFFRHLDHRDRAIADDALQEFARIDYRNVPVWARRLPADKLAGWLEQRNVPPARVRLYAPLLGDCGADRHAALLRHLIEQGRKQEGDRGLDGLLLGYTILRPRAGWAYVRGILGEAESPFAIRFQALRALRFIWGARPGLVRQEELVGGLLVLLGQGDMADLAVEELRTRKCWRPAEQVLGCYGKDSHAACIVRRAILRYALSCPDEPKVRAFLAERRRTDPDLVTELEEWLALEGRREPDSPLAR